MMSNDLLRLAELRERIDAIPVTMERLHLLGEFDALAGNLTPARLRELAALDAERQWRNIESAPKDGTRILVVTDTLVEVARWTGVVWSAENMNAALAAEYWQPLPSPPQAEGETP